jgi:hypothetical protein
MKKAPSSSSKKELAIVTQSITKSARTTTKATDNDDLSYVSSVANKEEVATITLIDEHDVKETEAFPVDETKETKAVPVDVADAKEVDGDVDELQDDANEAKEVGGDADELNDDANEAKEIGGDVDELLSDDAEDIDSEDVDDNLPERFLDNTFIEMSRAVHPK